jgi:hypothetical protein
MIIDFDASNQMAHFPSHGYECILCGDKFVSEAPKRFQQHSMLPLTLEKYYHGKL